MYEKWHRLQIITIRSKGNSKLANTIERLALAIPKRWMNGLMTRANRHALWRGYTSARRKIHLRCNHLIRRRRSAAKLKTISCHLDKWWCCRVPPHSIYYSNMDLKLRKRKRLEYVTHPSTTLTLSVTKLFQHIAEVKPKRIQLTAIFVQFFDEQLDHQPHFLDADTHKRRFRRQLRNVQLKLNSNIASVQKFNSAACVAYLVEFRRRNYYQIVNE